MEIERKFLSTDIDFDLESYPHLSYRQGYLCTDPVVRVRQEGDEYVLTYKGSGLMCREEYNMPLTKSAFESLVTKCDGIIIEKTRYRIPLEGGLTAETDVFEGIYAGLIITEVEFESEESAIAYIPPTWFGREVTMDSRYHNSNLSKGLTDVSKLLI